MNGTAAHGRHFALSSDAIVSRTQAWRTSYRHDADIALALGAREDATQLEEGLVQARVDDAEAHHTGGGSGIGGSMPGGWIS